jgi:hypothetical protein
MMWTAHVSTGIYESGAYTVRRCTHDYEIWHKPGKGDFKMLGRAKSVTEAKALVQALQDAQ